MKYIEELSPGEIFSWKNQRYVLSSDFRPLKDGYTKHMSVSINNGSCKWFSSNESVEIVDLYRRDKDGNILLVKEYDDDKKNQNIH